MNDNCKSKKETFLSEIDNDGFTKDEKLVIASQAFDFAYEQGVEDANAEHVSKTEAPEGQVHIQHDSILPDLSNKSDEEIEKEAQEVIGALAELSPIDDHYLPTVIRVNHYGLEIEKRREKGAVSVFKKLVKDAFKA